MIRAGFIIRIAIALLIVLGYNPAHIAQLIAMGVLKKGSEIVCAFFMFLGAAGYLCAILLKARSRLLKNARRNYKNYILLFSVIAVFLLLTEFALRFASFFDRRKVHCMHGYEVDYCWRKNSLGFRDDEFKKKKDMSTTRIFLIGDSFVEGSVQDEYTPDKLLEAKCRKDGFKCEVFNLGVSATGPSEYWLVAQKFRIYQPDAVVVSAYVDNDIEIEGCAVKGRHGEALGYVLPSEQYVPQHRWEWFNLIDGIRIKKEIKNRVNKCNIEGFYKNLMLEQKISPWIACRGGGRDYQELYEAFNEKFCTDPTFRWHIMSIRDLYSAVPFLLLINPSKYQVNVQYLTPMKKLGLVFKKDEILNRKLQDSIIWWCSRHGINYLDVLPDMLQSQENTLFFYQFDDHYTAQGYRFVADRLYDTLNDMGVFKKVKKGKGG